MHQMTLSPAVGHAGRLDRQLRHDEVVRGVDQVLDLVGRNGPIQGEGVPAVLADVGHLAGGTLIAVEQEVGGFAVTALQADPRLVSALPRKAKILSPTLATTSPSQGSSCHAPGLARQ